MTTALVLTSSAAGAASVAVVEIRHCVLKPDEVSYFSAQRRRTSRSGDGLD